MNDPINEEQYQRLCAYMFDELTAEERQAFQAELAASPALQAEHDQLQASADLVREFAPQAPVELSAATRGALTSAAESGGGAPQSVQAKPGKPNPWFLHPALQVAAAASLAVVGFRALEGVVGSGAASSSSHFGYRESADMVASSKGSPLTPNPTVSESMRELLQGSGYLDSLGYVDSEEAEAFASELGYTGSRGDILWKTGGGGAAGVSLDRSGLEAATSPPMKPDQALVLNAPAVPATGAPAPSEQPAGNSNWFLGPDTAGLGGGAGGGGRVAPNPASATSGGLYRGPSDSAPPPQARLEAQRVTGGVFGSSPLWDPSDDAAGGFGLRSAEPAGASGSFAQYYLGTTDESARVDPGEQSDSDRSSEQLAEALDFGFFGSAFDGDTVVIGPDADAEQALFGRYSDELLEAVVVVDRGRQGETAPAEEPESDPADLGGREPVVVDEAARLKKAAALVEEMTEEEQQAVAVEFERRVRERQAIDQAEAQRREQERIEDLYQGLVKSTQRHPDEKPSMMYFRFWGDNGFEFPVQDALSTFAADVDTASYTLARKYIQDGYLPERAQIRTEEFVNYFTPDVPAPMDGSTFNVTHEFAPSPFGPQGAVQVGPAAVADLSAERWTLRVGVRGKEIPKAERDPLALTFVIDVSGSMEQEGRLELVKHSLRLLMNELYPSDQIAIITFSNEAKRVLTMQPVSNRAAIEQALFDMRPDGGTNAEAGLLKGYEEAVLGFTEGAVNRVVFLSDGVGNIGKTNEQQLLDEVKRARDKGIYLNTVGVGMGNHNDRFLEQLANGGDGLCNYVDGPAEAERALVTNFTSAMQPIARDVKLQVEFDPSQVIAYRLLGYENRAIVDADFRNDKVDAGELGSGHQVVALYELVLGDVDTSGERPLVTTRVRHKVPHGEREEGAEDKATEAAFTGSWSHATGTFDGASIGFQKSALAAQFAEMLRRSTHAKDDSLSLLRLKLEELDRRTEDAELTELAALVRLAQPQLEAALSAPIPPAQQAFDELAQFEWRCGFSTYLERDLEDDVITSRREELRQNLREALR